MKNTLPLWCVESKRSKNPKAVASTKLKGLMKGIKSQLEVTPKVLQELSQTLFKERGKNPEPDIRF